MKMLPFSNEICYVLKIISHVVLIPQKERKVSAKLYIFIAETLLIGNYNIIASLKRKKIKIKNECIF